MKTKWTRMDDTDLYKPIGGYEIIHLEEVTV